jgi:hypothetical protein
MSQSSGASHKTACKTIQSPTIAPPKRNWLIEVRQPTQGPTNPREPISPSTCGGPI